MYNNLTKYGFYTGLIVALILVIRFGGCRKDGKELPEVPVASARISGSTLTIRSKPHIKFGTKPNEANKPTPGLPPQDSSNGVGLAPEEPESQEYLEDEQFIPIEGSIEVFIKDGELETVVKDKGFCFRPGLQGVVPFGLGNARPGLGFDIKLAYYRRYGLSVGGAFGLARQGPLDNLNLTSGVTYHLGGKLLKNTEFVAGILNFNTKTPYVGLRISF